MEGAVMTAGKLAVMGGAYGNLPALEACIADARALGCDTLAFTGDAIGFCGHSDEVLGMVRESFGVLVAGNHERQAHAGETTCGCGYSSAEDERLGCVAFETATHSLSPGMRRWLGEWPGSATVVLGGARVLLCHGSPSQTNEFVYESELGGGRLEGWLDEHGVRGFVCTHTGLPWVARLDAGRFAVNCGAVGKPPNLGDTRVCYAVLQHTSGGIDIELRRVAYDFEGWARRLEAEGVGQVFITPLKTGVWTCGVESMPEWERRKGEGTAP